MKIRKQFKHIRSKFKDGLESLGISSGSTGSSPNVQSGLAPTPSGGAQSQSQSRSPSPLLFSQLPPLHSEPQVGGASNVVWETSPPAEIQSPYPREPFSCTRDGQDDFPQSIVSSLGPASTVLTVGPSPSSHTSIPTSHLSSPLALARVKSTSVSAPKTWKFFNKFLKVLDSATTGFVPLKVVMGELGGIISLCEDAAKARSDYAALRSEFEGLFRVLGTHFAGDVPQTMTLGMNNLCIAIENELDSISTKEEQGAVRRYMESNKDLDDVVACYRRIQGHLERLRLNADLSLWKIVDKQATEALLKSLEPAMSACYNSAESDQVGRRECTPKTRQQVLARLSHWRHDKKQENMFWLSGMAGTGKTTIASSLAAMLDRSHELGASFFCTRLLPECRNVKLIIPTIAYQLARFSRPFYHTLALALEQDPDLHTKTLPIQFQGLIVTPLQKAASALPENLAMIIDALDECEDCQGVGLFLETLAHNAPNLPLKVFVSSRPEPQIRQNIGDPKSKLILHELEASTVKEDIKLYFQTELNKISVAIPDIDLSLLVERAGVLFIYAATVVRYIGTASSVPRRQKRVQTVLEIHTHGSSRTSTHIDALYNAILDSAFDNPDLEEDEVMDMKLVLDTVVCAQEPLTVRALAGLLQLDDDSSVSDALEPLWSVLHISSINHLVATLHASFPDYMLDPSRSKKYCCLSGEHHGRLADLCFDRINCNNKQINICGLESSYMFDSQVTDLDTRVAREIPQDLFYSCRYWAAHLKLGTPRTDHLLRIHKFVADRLLLWMEILNLRRQINIGALMIQIARLRCEDLQASQATIDLVHDAWRFVTMFATNNVSRSTPHLYVLMLASWPSSGPLASCFGRRVSGLNRVGGTGMTRRQLALLGILNAGAIITSVGLSPDGMRIVSSSEDNTIGVWDAQTCKSLLDPLRGHTDSVKSVVFSPDGTRIVSGSGDMTVRVWDAQTGKPLLHPLEGHTDSVNSVAVSPDSARIASGSSDGTIRIWGIHTGLLLHDLLQAHLSSIRAVAFSPNGTCVVSGSSDNTIRVWNVQSGNPLLGPILGHTDWINSVAFSPNGMRIVSCSDDSTIRVWDAQTGKPLLGPLSEHTNFVYSVGFSPDGTRIVSGSHDRTVRVWDAQTGRQVLGPLKGHTYKVRSVVFSPNGMHIVSSSSDMTIRVWDARTSLSPPDLHEGHTSSVNSVAFSPDGMQIASGSNDETIRVWDAKSGKSLLPPLSGHTSSVGSVAFSPDGTRIASGSTDTTVRVWSTQTGRLLLPPFVKHTSWVNSVSFSPNGLYIASGSSDMTIWVWDAMTGEPLLDQLEGHTDSVTSVAFSPDGTHIVSGSDDYTIRLWNSRSGQALSNPFEGHTDSVKSVAYSPDGKRVASGSSDYTIRVWSARNGRMLIGPLRGHTDKVRSVVFSPDGTRIVSGAYDNTIRVWDAYTGESLFDPLKGHTDSVNSVAFSLDGSYIVSGSYDSTIRVWSPPGFTTKPSLNYSNSWGFDEHGWVVDDNKRLLLWLPPDLRDRLVLSNMLCLVSTEGSVELDFQNAKRGDSWVDCYAPCRPE